MWWLSSYIDLCTIHTDRIADSNCVPRPFASSRQRRPYSCCSIIEHAPGHRGTQSVPSKSCLSHMAARSIRDICRHVVFRLSHKAKDVTPRPESVPRTLSLSCSTSASRMSCAASPYRCRKPDERRHNRHKRRADIPSN
ncbi:hypothetical protein BV25DRAFT_398998 [Artomyces pyxidatus]|uniref:Uncharacterized protein n=1 Tax=Artomyces pyxidatus TaxID=48021 RepID=A0ACB8T666_9AGAM|nr:hypothetical protein BV25DRAFT_398998 [Artomyces pyxidatus]